MKNQPETTENYNKFKVRNKIITFQSQYIKKSKTPGNRYKKVNFGQNNDFSNLTSEIDRSADDFKNR